MHGMLGDDDVDEKGKCGVCSNEAGKWWLRFGGPVSGVMPDWH